MYTQQTVNSEQYNQWTKKTLENRMSFNSPLTNSNEEWIYGNELHLRYLKQF